MSKLIVFFILFGVDLSAELQACLKEFTADGAIEIRENGGRVAPFSGLSWEVRGATEKPLLHLWSENYNLTRRVLAITDHSEQRDFVRYGYFPGIELQAAPPLVYLVAPALRFHPCTDTLLRFLSTELESTRVGLAESWRRGRHAPVSWWHHESTPYP